jgi:hypothetical protein
MIRHGVTNLKLSRKSGQTFAITKYFQHPKYSGTAYFDIAVLQISPVTFDYNLKPICLPDPAKFDQDQYNGKLSTVIGWGTDSLLGTTSPILKRTILTIRSNRYEQFSG